jgi:dTMP kinase
VAEINDFATGGLRPDRTLLLTIGPETGLARSRAREDPPDRLEREHDHFFEAVARAYDELEREDPVRITKIDAAQPPERVLEAALAALADLV